MTLEIQCASCQRVLQVPAEHAGKQARCPACGQISTIEAEAAGARKIHGAAAEGRTLGSAWSLRTPEGQVYGPITRGELDRWMAEGRITEDCEICSGAAEPWVAAEQVYPQLRAAAWTPPSPFVAPRAAGGVSPVYQLPHRGGLILVLGLLGFFLGCPIFSLMAWVMGSSDMRAIDAGQMDASGRGLTQAGQVIGAVLSWLWIGSCVLVVGIIVIAAVAGG